LVRRYFDNIGCSALFRYVGFDIPVHPGSCRQLLGYSIQKNARQTSFLSQRFPFRNSKW
jgi:hypothetical protein